MGVNLLGRNLHGADLQRARLMEAQLQNADLSGANLREVDLWGADLNHANLRNADLSDARLIVLRSQPGAPRRQHLTWSRPEWGRFERSGLDECRSAGDVGQRGELCQS